VQGGLHPGAPVIIGPGAQGRASGTGGGVVSPRWVASHERLGDSVFGPYPLLPGIGEEGRVVATGWGTEYWALSRPIVRIVQVTPPSPLECVFD
jgi:hypothetical protein